jgi:LysM repeat protein
MLRQSLAWVALATTLGIAPVSSARDGEIGKVGKGVHRVERGQVLGSIARRYGVTVGDLCRVNGITRDALLREGQRLVVPSSPSRHGKVEQPPTKPLLPRKPPPGASWAPYVKPAWRRGYITIAGHGRSWSGYVIGPGEEVLAHARQRIANVLASWRTGKSVQIDERLIRLLAHVSDTFGGRPIRIVGGYREQSHARQSKHFAGQALDFSIPGVPNEVLRDFLRTLPNVGVGYYPNSTHVHLDVREGKGYWVDVSRPGQGPKYGSETGPSRKVAGGR